MESARWALSFALAKSKADHYHSRQDTFDMDFDLVRRKGTIVTLGNASGPVAPFAPLKLGPKNLKSRFPNLFAR